MSFKGLGGPVPHFMLTTGRVPVELSVPVIAEVFLALGPTPATCWLKSVVSAFLFEFEFNIAINTV